MRPLCWGLEVAAVQWLGQPQVDQCLAQGKAVGHTRHVLQPEDSGIAHTLDRIDQVGIVGLSSEKLVAPGHAGAVEMADDVEVSLDVVKHRFPSMTCMW